MVGGNLMAIFQTNSLSSAGSVSPESRKARQGSLMPLHPSLQSEVLPSEPTRRPYFLMRRLTKSIRNQDGHWLTAHLYIPRLAWEQEGVRLFGLSTKMNAFEQVYMSICHHIVMLLELPPYSQNTYDIISITKEEFNLWKDMVNNEGCDEHGIENQEDRKKVIQGMEKKVDEGVNELKGLSGQHSRVAKMLRSMVKQLMEIQKQLSKSFSSIPEPRSISPILRCEYDQQSQGGYSEGGDLGNSPNLEGVSSPTFLPNERHFDNNSRSSTTESFTLSNQIRTSPNENRLSLSPGMENSGMENDMELINENGSEQVLISSIKSGFSNFSSMMSGFRAKVKKSASMAYENTKNTVQSSLLNTNSRVSSDEMIHYATLAAEVMHKAQMMDEMFVDVMKKKNKLQTLQQRSRGEENKNNSMELDQQHPQEKENQTKIIPTPPYPGATSILQEISIYEHHLDEILCLLAAIARFMKETILELLLSDLEILLDRYMKKMRKVFARMHWEDEMEGYRADLLGA